MLAILAAIILGLGAILSASGIHPANWLAPWTLLFVGLFLLALHLVWPVALPGRRA